MKRTVQLYIDNERIDLFDDENISVTSTIQNIKDIGKVFGDFSQTFSVPASRTNNKVFKHYYNFNIVGGFDARVKADSFIEINYVPFRKGKVRLESVEMRNNRPYSYRITFFGETITLKDLLGDAKLSSLADLSTYDTTYSASNMQTALKDGLTINSVSKALVAPLIVPTQYRPIWDSNAPAERGNMYPNGTTNAGVYYRDLKFAIRIHLIIQAIEAEYGITFSSDFFNSSNTAYYDLYMWLHRAKGESFESDVFTTLIDGYSPTGSTVRMYNTASKLVVIAATAGTLTYAIDFTTSTAQSYTAYLKKDGDVVAQVNCDNDTSVSLAGELEFTYVGYEVYIEASSSFDITVNWTATDSFFSESLTFSDTKTLNADIDFVITDQIPEMKIIDFLTGLFKMFNLTAYYSNNTIIVKTLDEFYSDSTTSWDINKYVIADSHTVSASLPYNTVDMNYSGLGTKLAKDHEERFNEAWGNLEYIGDQFYDYSPDTYDLSLPFEHMKYERLYNWNGNLTTVQVGWFVDSSDNPYYGKPLLTYCVELSNATLGSTPTNIRFMNDLVSDYDDLNKYHIPSNARTLFSTDTDPYTINFDQEVNEFVQNTSFDKTLFSEYYSNYLVSNFSQNKRITVLEAYFPLDFITKFSLADTIIFRENLYRINSIDIDLSTGKSKLELLNIV